jgi:hypothetical protein
MTTAVRGAVVRRLTGRGRDLIAIVPQEQFLE